jgi:hypothetical protein
MKSNSYIADHLHPVRGASLPDSRVAFTPYELMTPNCVVGRRRLISRR